MVKEYNLQQHNTIKSIAEDNNLMESPYCENVYYDLSLLNDIKIRDKEHTTMSGKAKEKDIIIDNLMRNQVHYSDQPLPTFILINKLCHIVGQINTVYHEINNNKTDNRIMIIVEVVSIELNVEERNTIYEDRFKIVEKYSADNHHAQPTNK